MNSRFSCFTEEELLILTEALTNCGNVLLVQEIREEHDRRRYIRERCVEWTNKTK